jgi:predicted Zn-dependent peptidase
MQYNYHRLKNGIRIIHKSASSPVAHCGIVINAGTKNEPIALNGIAHFIEHVIFKGTKKRKAFHILSRLENVGGDLNAYTAKEETFLYASFLNEYYDRALELFSDILFNSTFPDKEIAKEKEVVLDEINSYKDSPAELIFDEFEELIYKGHPLGRPILGTPETVKSFDRGHVADFIAQNYLPEKMVIASVGNVSFAKLISICEKYFEAAENRNHIQSPIELVSYAPEKLVEEKSNFQTHAIIGVPAYPVKDAKRNALALLNNMLGGPGMNSRLNLNIREKYGYCYSIESHYIPYSDTGNFHIYLGTDNGYLEKSLKLIQKELKILRDIKAGTLQLHRAKQQLKGQLAISLESNLNEMISIGKSHLFYDDVDTFDQIAEKIDQITAEQLLEVANEIFIPENFSQLTYLPRK